MGEARSKLEMYQRRRAALATWEEQQRQYLQTVPSRFFKMIAGMVLFIPLVFFCFTIACFKQNKWPWDLQ